MADGNYDPIRSQRHSPIGGSLAAGAALASATPVTVCVQLAGAARARIYFKSSAAGTLDVYPLKANRAGGILSTDRLDTKLATVAISANTEALAEFDLYGEHGCQVVFTPSGNGTVTHAEIARV